MKKSTMIVCVALGLVLVILGVFVGMRETFFGGVEEYWKDEEYWDAETVGEFPIADIASIQVETQGMDVRIYDGWNKTIEVDVSAKHTKNVQVWQQEDTLYIRQKGGESVLVGDRGQISIWLPKGGQGTLSVLSGSGDVTFSGIRGEGLEVELATTSGEMSVYSSRLGSLTVSTSSGDLYLNEVEVYGPLKLSTVSGYLNYYDVESGDTVVETVSGDVYMSDVQSDSLSVKTTSGNVNISDINIPGLRVETTSGDMWLTLPGDLDDYAVSVSTVSGDIDGVENRTKGKWDLTLSTVSGDIMVTFE